jgi:hypothetical protein
MKQPKQSSAQMTLRRTDVDADASSRIKPKAKHSALLAAIGIGAAAPLALMVAGVNASQISTGMSVSANVVANAVLHSDYQADQLSISLADVARGYVDAASGSRFSVQTNANSGYLIVFYPVGDLFESVQISGLRTTVHFGREGGFAVQRGLPKSGVVHDLNFRFFLNAQTLPGQYPWPLHLSARALD